MKRPAPGIDCYCWSIVFLSLAQAVPVARGPNSGESQRLEEAANSNTVDLNKACFYGNEVYAEGQNFTTSNPCETCICHPPAFACSLRSCDMRPGCKAIHSANKCCPEYSCECEVNGRKYANGEKVEEPTNPCKVCYCKGGEIKCSELTCYKRDDCEAVYTPGICCPKYDHCPTLEMIKNKSTPKPSLVIISDLTTQSSTAENKNTSSEEASTTEDQSDEISESPEPSKPTTAKPSEGTTQFQSVATLEIIEIHPNMGITPTTPSIFRTTEVTKTKPVTEEVTTTQIPQTTYVWTEDESIDTEEVSNDFETTEGGLKKKTTETIPTPETTTTPFEMEALPPLDSNDLNLARMRNQSEDNDESFESVENDTRSDESRDSVEFSAQEEGSDNVNGNETLARNDFEEVENVTMDVELPARIGDEVTTEEMEENTTEAKSISKENLEEDLMFSDSQESTTTVLYINTVENVEEDKETVENVEEDKQEVENVEKDKETEEKENIQINNDTTTEEILELTTSENIVSSHSIPVEEVTETPSDVEIVTDDDLVISTIAPLVESTTVTEKSSAPLQLEVNTTGRIFLDDYESSTRNDAGEVFTSATAAETIPNSITEYFKNLEQRQTERYVEETTASFEKFESTTLDPVESTPAYQSSDEITTLSENLSTVRHVGRMISNTPEASDVENTTEDSTEFSQEIIEKDNLSEANDSSEWGSPSEMEDSFEELTTKQPQIYSTYMSILDRITVVPPEKIQEFVTEPVAEESGFNPDNDSLSEGYESGNETSSEEISEESFTNSTANSAESAESIKEVLNVTSQNIPFKYPSEDGSAPVMVMISADQIQFLKIGEEPPLYVDNPPSSSSKSEESNSSPNQEIVIVPKTTPITVDMVKVVNGKIENSTVTEDDISSSSEFSPNQNSTSESLVDDSSVQVDSTSDSVEVSDEEDEDLITKDNPSASPSSNATGIIEER